MGDGGQDDLRVSLDRKSRLDFPGTKVTSATGLLAYRESGEVLVSTRMAGFEVRDNRTGRNTRHSIAALPERPIGRL